MSGRVQPWIVKYLSNHANSRKDNTLYDEKSKTVQIIKFATDGSQTLKQGEVWAHMSDKSNWIHARISKKSIEEHEKQHQGERMTSLQGAVFFVRRYRPILEDIPEFADTWRLREQSLALEVEVEFIAGRGKVATFDDPSHVSSNTTIDNWEKTLRVQGFPVILSPSHHELGSETARPELTPNDQSHRATSVVTLAPVHDSVRGGRISPKESSNVRSQSSRPNSSPPSEPNPLKAYYKRIGGVYGFEWTPDIGKIPEDQRKILNGFKEWRQNSNVQNEDTDSEVDDHGSQPASQEIEYAWSDSDREDDEIDHGIDAQTGAGNDDPTEPVLSSTSPRNNLGRLRSPNVRPVPVTSSLHVPTPAQRRRPRRSLTKSPSHQSQAESQDDDDIISDSERSRLGSIPSETSSVPPPSPSPSNPLTTSRSLSAIQPTQPSDSYVPSYISDSELSQFHQHLEEGCHCAHLEPPSSFRSQSDIRTFKPTPSAERQSSIVLIAPSVVVGLQSNPSAPKRTHREQSNNYNGKNGSPGLPSEQEPARKRRRLSLRGTEADVAAGDHDHDAWRNPDFLRKRETRGATVPQEGSRLTESVTAVPPPSELLHGGDEYDEHFRDEHDYQGFLAARLGLPENWDRGSNDLRDSLASDAAASKLKDVRSEGRADASVTREFHSHLEVASTIVTGAKRHASAVDLASSRSLKKPSILPKDNTDPNLGRANLSYERIDSQGQGLSHLGVPAMEKQLSAASFVQEPLLRWAGNPVTSSTAAIPVAPSWSASTTPHERSRPPEAFQPLQQERLQTPTTVPIELPKPAMAHTRSARKSTGGLSAVHPSKTSRVISNSVRPGKRASPFASSSEEPEEAAPTKTEESSTMQSRVTSRFRFGRHQETSPQKPSLRPTDRSRLAREVAATSAKPPPPFIQGTESNRASSMTVSTPISRPVPNEDALPNGTLPEVVNGVSPLVAHTRMRREGGLKDREQETAASFQVHSGPDIVVQEPSGVADEPERSRRMHIKRPPSPEIQVTQIKQYGLGRPLKLPLLGGFRPNLDFSADETATWFTVSDLAKVLRKIDRYRAGEL